LFLVAHEMQVEFTLRGICPTLPNVLNRSYAGVKNRLVGESMRHTVLATIIALSALAVLSIGCGSGAPPSANSFTEVYAKTIQPSCSSDFCHYNGVDIRFSALDLSSKVRAYYSLVGLPCLGPTCQQRGMRVVPGQPEASVMYQKLLDQLPAGIARCGKQMPADRTGYSTNGTSDLTFFRCDAGAPPNCRDATLPADQLLRIHDWIQEGAQDN
jgi:hypothetical protein